MSTQNGVAFAKVRARMRRSLEAPPDLTPTQWADRYRELSPEGSAKRGKFNSADCPYQLEFMNSVREEAVQTVVAMWASQTGKTECINNLVGFFMDAEPSPILMVQPTVEMAEAWSKERLDPMIRDTKRLRDLVQPSRSRDSGNTILRKTFPGGNIAIVGANAPSGLAGRPRRCVFLDEIDRPTGETGREGDFVSLAIRRTESFHNAVVVLTSTPTVQGASRIEAEFEQTDKRRWFCPCPRCGHEQVLKWSQVQWEKDQPETAHYVCESCNAKLDDSERVQMVKRGKWVATAPFKGRRGYHLNGINSLFRHKNGFLNRLHQMVEDFLRSKRTGRDALKTWTNTFLAETWGEEGETIDDGILMARRESYSSVPVGVLMLTAGVDVQADRIEVSVYGWGEGEESWCILHRVIPGKYDTEQPWDGLDDLLAERFDREDGITLIIQRTFVDFGDGKAALHVLKQTKKRFVRGVLACKGANTSDFPLCGPESRSNKLRAPTHRVGTHAAKAMLMSRLKETTPGPGYIHFTAHPYAGQGKSFFDGLTAEQARPRKVKGHIVIEWHKIKSRNEPLDCAVYALAAMYQRPTNWPRLKANLEARKPTAESNGEQREVEQKPDDVRVGQTRTYELRPHPDPAGSKSAAEPVQEARPQAAQRKPRFIRRPGISSWK